MYTKSPQFSATYLAEFHSFQFDPKRQFDDECGYGRHAPSRVEHELWKGDHTPSLPELTTPLIDCLNFLYDPESGIYKSLVPEGSRLREEKVFVYAGRILLPGKKALEVISLEDILAFDPDHQSVA